MVAINSTEQHDSMFDFLFYDWPIAKINTKQQSTPTDLPIYF